jgi:hypothetical protein
MKVPLKVANLKVGDFIHSDATGKVVLKVVQIDTKASEVTLWNERCMRIRRLDFESLEKFWSAGKANHGWKFKS